jgi:carbon monoxide dehydrogenase subunit G
MELAGQYRLHGAREEAWDLLLAPEALQRALPGCQQLTVEGDGRYAVILKVGVAAIKGTITGKVSILDQRKADCFTMGVEGKGSIGIASGKALLQLDEAGDATVVRVSGEAEVHGLVASVGQRLLRGVAGRMMDEFFKSIDQQLREQKQRAGAPAAAQGAAE